MWCVCSNVRGEDVRIYRLRMPPMYAKGLLREYVAEANDVARSPRWYNTFDAGAIRWAARAATAPSD